MKRKKTIDERFDKFFRDFIKLNSDNVEDFDMEYRICPKVLCRKLLVYNDGNKDLVLPLGYSVYTDKKTLNENSYETYIMDKNGYVVCGIYHNEIGDSLFTNFEKPYPKKNIVSYNEHILEEASIITESYLGKDKDDYLHLALKSMIDGNYGYFPKYNNIRFKLTLIKRTDIFRVMLSTLERNTINGNLSSVSTVTNDYVNYIKSKVKSFDRVNETNTRKLVKSR